MSKKKKKKGTGKIFEEVIVENFPNMGKEIVNQVQEVQRVPYRINPRRNTPRRILIKLSKIKYRSSLVVQWLRIHLPMQGTRVQSLVREDPTCRRATKPVSHNYWACALEPSSHNYWAHEPQSLSLCATTTAAHAPRPCAPQQEKPPQWEACSLQWRVAPARHN